MYEDFMDTVLNRLIEAKIVGNDEVRKRMPRKPPPEGLVIFRSKKNNRLKNTLTRFSDGGHKVFSMVEGATALVFVSKDKSRIEEISDFILNSLPSEVW